MNNEREKNFIIQFDPAPTAARLFVHGWFCSYVLCAPDMEQLRPLRARTNGRSVVTSSVHS